MLLTFINKYSYLVHKAKWSVLLNDMYDFNDLIKNFLVWDFSQLFCKSLTHHVSE
jgi:hypothetical protein